MPLYWVLREVKKKKKRGINNYEKRRINVNNDFFG